MSQILSASLKLNDSQTNIVINNLATIRHLTKIEKIFEGKPNYGQEQINELKRLLNHDNFIKVTKFANKYTIYLLSDPKPASYTKELQKYNKNVEILNLHQRKEILIVLDADKFDKQHYIAILGLWPIIKPHLDENSDDCLVTIASTNIISQAITKHFINSVILPCNYRLFSLCEIYPLIGSKNSLWCGSSRDFELIKYEPLYNKNEYQIIYDDDPVVKIMNAKNNDLIICKQTYFETSPYTEFSIRQVRAKLNDAESLDISGLHIEE